MSRRELETRVLIVEDDEELASRLKRFFPATMTCDVACTVLDALTFLAFHAPMHGLLVDIALPDGVGWELVEPFRERYPNAPILVMTGSADLHETANKANALRAGFLSKPFGRRALEPFFDDVSTMRWGVPRAITAPFERYVRHHRCTDKQAALLAAWANGLRGERIDERLGITANTRKTNIQRFLDKVGARVMERTYDAMLKA